MGTYKRLNEEIDRQQRGQWYKVERTLAMVLSIERHICGFVTGKVRAEAYTFRMTLVLDPVTEERLQQELAAGRYPEPSALISHALDLVEAERADAEAMNDWLVRNKAAINAAIEESFAAKERGEIYTPEQVEAKLAERRAARAQRMA